MRNLTAALVLLMSATPAFAEQANCGPRPQLLGYLSSKFSESPVALGITTDGNVLEVAASGAGTWTILLTTPAGTTCAIAAGEKWSSPGAKTRIPDEEDDL